MALAAGGAAGRKFWADDQGTSTIEAAMAMGMMAVGRGLSSALTRRGWLRGAGVVIAAAGLDTGLLNGQPAQPNAFVFRVLPEEALPFPAGPVGTLAAPVLEAQKAVDRIMRTVYGRLFQARGRALAWGMSPVAHDMQLGALYQGLVAATMRAIADDIVQAHVLTPAQFKQLQTQFESPDMATRSQAIQALLFRHLPKYFAVRGIYFRFGPSTYFNRNVPFVNFAKIRSIEPVSEELPVYPGAPARYRLYHVEPNLVVLPAEASKGILPRTIGLHTITRSDQVVMEDDVVDAFRQEAANGLAEEIRNYPKLLQGQPLSEKDDPDPMMRAARTLTVRGLVAAGSPMERITPQNILQRLIRINNLLSRRHEALHVHRGLLAAAGRLTYLAGDREEEIADTGAAIGLTGAAYAVGGILHETAKFKRTGIPLNGGAHGPDLIDLSDRLAMALWQNAGLRQALGVRAAPPAGPVIPWSNLPAATQNQVWEGISQLTDAQAWTLLRAVWPDLQGPAPAAKKASTHLLPRDSFRAARAA